MKNLNYRLCCADHECKKNEAYSFDVSDYRDHEINVVNTFGSKEEALVALNECGSMILDYGRYCLVRMYYVESYDEKYDEWTIEEVAEMARKD